MECGSLDSMFEPTEENMQMKNSTKPYLLFLSGPPDDIAEQNMLNMLSGWLSIKVRLLLWAKEFGLRLRHNTFQLLVHIV